MNKYDTQVVTKMLNSIEALNAEMLDGVRRNRERRIEEVRDNWNERYGTLHQELAILCHHVLNTSYAGEELKTIARDTATRFGIVVIEKEDSDKGPELDLPEKPEDLS